MPYRIQTATKDYIVSAEMLEREIEHYIVSEYNILDDDKNKRITKAWDYKLPTMVFFRVMK
jgi:hypothetical protein